ncbi:MAG TPA: TonB-dependent receptor [Opitutaceae bacterium]|nr:TonB-dependent receptor [Opitutaceae bacterium]
MTSHLNPRSLFLALRIPLLALATCAAAHAQSSTGTISGRVFNPTTQEFVRNAEVAVPGTNLVTYTADDGTYSLSGLPPGATTLSVTYTGYEPASAQLNVSAGASAVRDFDLTPALFAPKSSGASAPGIVQLGQFVVSSEREGNAKAIMEQRAAVNFKSVVASDNFGDVTGGNVGEFIKYLPGVVMDYVDSDARTARIGGLSPVYTGVSVDGMTMASAPSASFGDTSRQFEFEQASINGIESIEISKTSTASMDADSPAGRINLRSRSAFDRKNREITTQLTFTGNEYSWSLKKTPGPYNDSYYKIRPGFLLSYADAFKGKFGIQLSLGGNTVGTEQAGVTHTYAYLPNRGPVITQIAFRDAPKLSNRASFSLNTDYKISPNLSVALRTSGSHFDDGTNLRQTAFFVNQAQLTPDSTSTSFTALPTANANTRVQYTTSRRNKINTTVTYVPKLEYKRGDLNLTLGGGYSRSRTAYEQLTEGYFQAVTHRLTRIGYTASRSSPTDTDWQLTQTAGLPWNDPANYNRTDAFANNVSATPQAARHQVWVAYIDLKKTINLGNQPFQLLAGAKRKLSVYDLEKNGALQYTYVGAAGSQTDPSTRLPITNLLPYDARTGGNIVSLGIPMTDPYATAALFKANPSHFTPNLIPNYINENYSSRSVKEQIDAYYLEGNTRWRAIRLNLGVRQEQTTTIGKTIDLRTPAAARAAGYTANTIPFVDYQYRNGQRSAKEGGYDNTFFSGGAKYAFNRNLHLQVAASQSISRPSYGNVAGIITIDETNQTIRVPNPNLKPETSDKFFASIQYYLEPAGTLSLTGFRLSVDNMGIGNNQVSAAEAGYADDPEYGGFTFSRPSNAPGTINLDGVELEYSQQLVFLPQAFRGFSVFGSLSRTAASERIESHVPKSANGGIRYGNDKFSAQLRCTWQASRFNSASATEEIWQYERLMFDFSGSYKFNRHYELTVSGRNILNEPIRTYSNTPGLLRVINHYGASWTVGVRGRW